MGLNWFSLRTRPWCFLFQFCYHACDFIFLYSSLNSQIFLLSEWQTLHFWFLPIQFSSLTITCFMTMFSYIFKNLIQVSSSTGSSHSKLIDHFVGMGFPEKMVRKAIEENGNWTVSSWRLFFSLKAAYISAICRRRKYRINPRNFAYILREFYMPYSQIPSNIVLKIELNWISPFSPFQNIKLVLQICFTVSVISLNSDFIPSHW